MKRTSKTHVLDWLDAVAAANVPTAAKAVALIMATHADYGTGQNMRAGTARIAHMAGLAERHTRSMIRTLRDAGLITWDGVPTHRGRTRTYALTIPTRITDKPMTRVTGAHDGGNIVPPSQDERRQNTTVTAAKYDRNGGSGLQPTKALPGPDQGALRAAPERRAAALADNASPTVDGLDVDPQWLGQPAPLQRLRQRMNMQGLGAIELTTDVHSNGTPWAEVTQWLNPDELLHFISLNVEGENYNAPRCIMMESPRGARLINRVRTWLDVTGVSSQVERDDDDDADRLILSLHPETELSDIVDRLPILVEIWATECANAEAQVS